MKESLIKKREDMGLTRKQLAETLDISVSMIEKVEKGTRRASTKLAQKWGKKIGIRETQLFRYFFNNESDIMSDLNIEKAAAFQKTG